MTKKTSKVWTLSEQGGRSLGGMVRSSLLCEQVIQTFLVGEKFILGNKICCGQNDLQKASEPH